jgi:hypothetical protein
MRGLLMVLTTLLALGLTFSSALAEAAIADEPEVRGWAMVQEGPSVAYEKDVVRGDILPSSIALAEVPSYPQYGFVILNTERVIVDAQSREVIAVY